MKAFVLEGRTPTRIAVRFGNRSILVAVVYAPGPPRDFVCFEPMSAVTNAFNLSAQLQHIAPGTTWRESFWVAPSGF